MAFLRTKVVGQAKTWLGSNEKDGTHKNIIDVYNSHTPLARGYKVKYTDSWCATFVSAVAIKLGYTDIIPTECSCAEMIKAFQILGIWVEDDAFIPKPGDIVFYDWGDAGKGDNKSRPDHVGIVEKVVNGKITVIEGNHDGSDPDRVDGVERRVIFVNGKYIRGYGTPKYDTSGTQDLDKLSVDGIWGVRTTEKAQQVFNTTVDGKVSNQYKRYAKNNPGLSAATFDWKSKPTGSSRLIKAIQKKIDIEQDGHIGPNTVKAMQRWLNTTQDGTVSRPSEMVKAFQEWLNCQ